MNTSNPQTSLPNSDMVQLKIVADSAGEAVKTIKERFGESTKVLSVKQKEAGGLTGLLKKPRLEIVVEVPRSRIDPNARSREKIAPKAPEPKASEETATEAVGEQDETAEVARKPITDLYSKTGNDEKSG